MTQKTAAKIHARIATIRNVAQDPDPKQRGHCVGSDGRVLESGQDHRFDETTIEKQRSHDTRDVGTGEKGSGESGESTEQEEGGNGQVSIYDYRIDDTIAKKAMRADGHKTEQRKMRPR